MAWSKTLLPWLVLPLVLSGCSLFSSRPRSGVLSGTAPANRGSAAQKLAGERPGDGWYASVFAAVSSLKNNGQFTTGPPIQTVETVRYVEKIASYGFGGALGYGGYDWLAPDVYLGMEINGAYIPFDKNPASPNPNFRLSVERNFRLGAKALVGTSVGSNGLFFGHVGYYYSDHRYGAGYRTESGWDDHDITGPGFGLGYRKVITPQLDFAVEYTYITYDMDQPLKDGAASKQRIRDHDVSIGLSYRF